MGCLNSNSDFNHWFGNIHLSGPCNRSCYFCIGQHMMEVDSLNNLSKWPLENLDLFIEKCKKRNITEVNLTGTNTDPSLYNNHFGLRQYLKKNLSSQLVFGIRTNGCSNISSLFIYDKISISITSFDPAIYMKTMGNGSPPDILKINNLLYTSKLKVNIVLCPEILPDDLFRTLDHLSNCGIQKVNLREPYGQPHIGDPLNGKLNIAGYIFGMPQYKYRGMSVVYWDVHYVEVESVNLYANGNVSEYYPITKGYHNNGQVSDQSKFIKSGRVISQWL